jgi:putative acetyltransferase
MDIVIRNEIKSDIKAISEITKAAFETLAVSNQTEQFIIDALRDANALTISLVAVAGKRVVGHIAFSPVTISDGSPGGMVWVPSQSCRNCRSRVLENP